MSNLSILEDETPVVMGILNVTPDSFSDGGKFNNIESALKQAEQMLQDGARILDVGGESTRPGAQAVSLDEELQRVVPVIEAIKSRFDCLVSIDTSKAHVMRESVAAGADLINDVCALQEDGALEEAARLNVPVCLMHMQGQPRTMQTAPHYENVVAEIQQFLLQRAQACIDAGISKENIILDPGFGFGKTLEHNCEILANIGAMVKSLPYPLLIGLSRKSMFGGLLGCDVANRLTPSVVAATLCMQQGAKIARVHDVRETADALQILAVMQS